MFIYVTYTISIGKWSEGLDVQSIIFASTEGVVMTMMIRSRLLWTMFGNLEEIKNFCFRSHSTKPKLTVDCERIATAISHFHVSFSVVNGGWPIILQLAENSWFNHQFFSSYLKFLIQARTVSLLFENCHSLEP